MHNAIHEPRMDSKNVKRIKIKVNDHQFWQLRNLKWRKKAQYLALPFSTIYNFTYDFFRRLLILLHAINLQCPLIIQNYRNFVSMQYMKIVILQQQKHNGLNNANNLILYNICVSYV